jgi:O-antigen/teichoic acid export membrane protein
MITNSLFWIVVFLISTRIIIWILYLIQCFAVNERIRKGIRIDFKSIQPVLKFSIWITLGNIVVPIIQYSDRFLIAALISAATVTYYVTPYEVITKLILIPDAILGVLFPLFSSSFHSKPDIAKKLFSTGAKVIFLILYPIVFLVTIFSFEGISFWLGERFAQNSYFILQLLAIGVMMNCISLIPTNFFQGIGKPNIPSILVLIELPVYVFSMWFAITHAGVNGAAMVFMIATIINVTILYLIANKKYSIKFESRIKGYSFISLLIGLILPFIVKSLFLKILLSSCLIIIFPIIAWKFLLSDEEKFFIASKLKLNSKLLH